MASKAFIKVKAFQELFYLVVMIGPLLIAGLVAHLIVIDSPCIREPMGVIAGCILQEILAWIQRGS